MSNTIHQALEISRTAHTPKIRHDDAIGGERGFDFYGGLIHSPVAGRTDRLPLNVPSGSYILPADVVSGFGQGNTLAGARIIEKCFAGAPKRPSGPVKMAAIIAAGGEFSVPPHWVAFLGDGDMKKGHDELDDVVKLVRDKTKKTLRALPGPKK